MYSRILHAALCGAVLAGINAASAHEIVGNRMFPATLTIDDPSFKQRDISADYSKRITEDFAVSFSPTHTRIYAPGGPTMNGASGFQNIETTFKYRLFKNEEHEFVMSAGLN